MRHQQNRRSAARLRRAADSGATGVLCLLRAWAVGRPEREPYRPRLHLTRTPHGAPACVTTIAFAAPGTVPTTSHPQQDYAVPAALAST